MTKNIISTALIMVMTVAVFNKQISEAIWPEKPVSKEISFAIASDNNYSSAAYENSVATVHVKVIKVRNGKQSVIWEKNFDTLQLKNYPRVNEAYLQNITIPKVYDKKENVIVTYTVTYNTQGNILQVANGSIVPNGVIKDKLFIKI